MIDRFLHKESILLNQQRNDAITPKRVIASGGWPAVAGTRRNLCGGRRSGPARAVAMGRPGAAHVRTETTHDSDTHGLPMGHGRTETTSTRVPYHSMAHW